MHLFGTALDRLGDRSTLRLTTAKLEDTLRLLVVKMQTGVEDMRKVWQFRLKRLLDKNATDALRCHKSVQTSPERKDSLGRRETESIGWEGADELGGIRFQTGSLDGSIGEGSRDLGRNWYIKDLSKEFIEVADRKGLHPTRSNRPVEVLRPLPISPAPIEKNKLPLNLQNRRRPLCRSIQIEIPNSRHNYKKPPNRSRDSSETSEDLSLALPTNSSQATEFGRNERERSFFDSSVGVGSLANRQHRTHTSPEVRLSQKLKELENSQMISECLNELNDELYHFKKNSKNCQIFNPYIDFIYEQRENAPNSSSLYRLKRLRLEEKFLDDNTLLAPLLQTLSTFHKKFENNTKLACFVIKSLKTLLKLTDKTCCSLRDLQFSLSRVLQGSNSTSRIELLNEEIARLRDYEARHSDLLACYRARAELKAKMFEQCSKHAGVNSAKAVAMLTASDNSRVIGLDDRILELIEKLKSREDLVMPYKGLDMEDLVEIDLWEVNCLNKMRRHY